MINGKKVVVVMPAFNAATTLKKTYAELPAIVDEVVVVDDHSSDTTVAVAKQLGIRQVIRHDENMGYGGNQKTCYQTALALEADIVVMVHPDYQYTPKLVTAMASMIAYDVYDVVIASRILGVGALKGGMPVYKYIANRFLTLVQNLLIGYKLSEYHTGFRAFSRQVLQHLPLEGNSDQFIFDNQMLAQVIYSNMTIGEVSCPTRYDRDSSSINLSNSVKYGLGVLKVSLHYRLHKLKWLTSPLFACLDKR